MFDLDAMHEAETRLRELSPPDRTPRDAVEPAPAGPAPVCPALQVARCPFLHGEAA